MNASWVPGSPLHLSTPRVHLRTLSVADLDALAAPGEGAGPPSWYGSKERRAHVWEPPMKTVDYLRKLIDACDQRERFAFLVRTPDDAPIGFFKAQLVRTPAHLQVVPTIVIGDETRAGQHLGAEATGLFLWFSFGHLGVTQVCVKFYEENAATAHLVRAYGYAPLAPETERQPDGSCRRVEVWAIERDAWLDRNRESLPSFRIHPSLRIHRADETSGNSS